VTSDQDRLASAANSSAPGPSAWLLAAGLTVANLLVTFWGLLLVLDWYGRQIDPDHDYLLAQEIWAPMLVLLVVQAAVNGLLLLSRHATRRVGVGVLTGTLAVVVSLLLFFMIVVAPEWA